MTPNWKFLTATQTYFLYSIIEQKTLVYPISIVPSIQTPYSSIADNTFGNNTPFL